jgi:predicted Fe-S protein YdhL (DUF1289 family)
MNVCVLDAERVCVGCRRTLEEITGWGRMSAAEQWAVVDRLERARRGAAAGAAPVEAGASTG